MLIVHWGLDALLGALFIGAAWFARRSFIVHQKILTVLLGLLYIDHVLLANGAGYLYIVFDFPIMLLISWRCLVRFRWARVYATAT